MKRIEDRKNFIIRGDNFDIAFAEYFFSENKTVYNLLNEKKHRLDSSEVSYRVITHWENMGLLTSNRPEGKGWRKYSILDIVWVHIITELRNFGLSIEQILVVKENLSFGDNSLSPFPELEFFIAFAFNRVPSFLAIFANGEAIPCTLSDYQLAIKTGLIGNSILISINDILQKLFPKKDFKPVYSNSYDLSKDEVELLVAIRLNQWSEIKIKGKDGKINMIERTEDVDDEKKIVEILKSGKYQNIELKQENGKVVSVKRTIKQKL